MSAHIAQTLALEGVSFSYKKSGMGLFGAAAAPQVLDNIDFTLNTGVTTGLVGESAAANRPLPNCCSA